jgi:HlyD family secretion protein
MKQFLNKKGIWWIVAIILVLTAILLIGYTDDNTPLNTTVIKRDNIIQKVSVTGKVKPMSVVNLGFEKNGRIAGIYAHVGQQVKANSLLAELEMLSAKASLLEAEAKLKELRRGPRPEEIAVKEAELAKYTQDLENAYAGVLDTINDGFTKSDDALHVKISGIFSGTKTSSYKFTFPVCDSQLDINSAQLRQSTELDFETWRNQLTSLFMKKMDSKELSAAITGAEQHIQSVKLFLEATSRALTLDCAIANSSLDTYRDNINIARTNVIMALSAVTTKKSIISERILSAAKIRDELALLHAGTTEEQIAAQEARILAAQADILKHKIFSPVPGTLSMVDGEVGEFTESGATLISVISDDAFEMKTNVPEVDIIKIKKGDIARITLDAYGADVLFEGHVVAIEPAETMIDNVSTYKVTLWFLKNDPRIRSGMTANIDIQTASKESALIIPTRALVTKESGKFVFVVNPDGAIVEVPVVTGLRGSDGMIEILTGPSEGTVIMSNSQEKVL